jgi:class 3 adenylate cyclase
MEQAFARQEAIMRGVMERGLAVMFIKWWAMPFKSLFRRLRLRRMLQLKRSADCRLKMWGEHGPLLVRMALHTAVVEERADDYVGPQLNRVARLLGAGSAGKYC